MVTPWVCRGLSCCSAYPLFLPDCPAVMSLAWRSKRDRLQIIELIEWNNELRTIGVSPGMHSHLETHRIPCGPEAEWAGQLELPE
jgi:hypothetical protein